MFDGKTQSERKINPFAALQRRRQGGYEPSTRSRPRKMPRILARSAHIKDEIVGGDDRCRARCSIQVASSPKAVPAQRSRDGCLRRRPAAGTRSRYWLFFVIRGAFVPPAETR